MKKSLKFLFATLLTGVVAIFSGCGDSNSETPTPQPTPTPTPTPTPQGNFASYNGVDIELKSAAFTYTKDEEVGNYYTLIFSPIDGLNTFEGLLNAEQMAFFQIDEQVVNSLAGNKLNLMDIDEGDIVYMLIATLSGVDIVDLAYSRDITSGSVTLNLDKNPSSGSIAKIELEVVDWTGKKFTLSGEAPFIEYQKYDPENLTENFIKYTVGDKSVGKPIEAPFYSQDNSGVTYALAAGDISTYARLEDTPHMMIYAKGRTSNDNFTIDFTDADSDYLIVICDPIKGYYYSFSAEDYLNLDGEFEIVDGVINCSLIYDSPNGESEDLEFLANFNRKSFRRVNEVNQILNLRRTLSFTPNSVVYDQSGDNHKIYISSRNDLTTVVEMADAEVVITYPKDALPTLEKGNFVASSSWPEMEITFNGKRYKRGEPGVNGLNLCITKWDRENNSFTLMSEAYASSNSNIGMALYYSGKYILIE